MSQPPPPVIDSQVPDHLAALGIPGIIDVHVHFMPKSVMDKVWEYFVRGGEKVGRPWPITYRTDVQTRLATLAGLGVKRFGCLSYAHKPGMAQWLSEWSLDFAARTPGAIPTATFYPEDGVEAYVSDAIDGGAELFKVHIQVGDFDPRDPLLDKVWGLLAEAEVPVVVHAGSGPLPGRFTGPEPFGEVLGRHPSLPAIIAHMGGPEVDEFLTMTEQFGNCRLDTTMAGTRFLEDIHTFDRSLLPRIKDAGLAGKVLFGSDFPNIPYPYAHQIESLHDWGLGVDWMRAVLWHNGVELFGSGD